MAIMPRSVFKSRVLLLRVDDTLAGARYAETKSDALLTAASALRANSQRLVALASRDFPIDDVLSPPRTLRESDGGTAV